MSFKPISLFIVFLLAGAASAATNATSSGDLFQTLWESDLSGEVNHVRVADLNGDGTGEVVADSLFITSYGKSGTVYGLDSRGMQSWKFLSGLLADTYTSSDGYTLVGGGPYVSLLSPGGQEVWKRSTRDAASQGIYSQAVYLSDLNNDGKNEALVATNLGMKGTELAIRSNSGEQTGTITYKGLESPYVLYAADLDGAGKEEIMVGSIKYSVNTVGGTYQSAYSKPTTFSVYDSSGAIKWTDNYESAVTAVKACDINGDGKLEVLTGSIGQVVAYAPSGKRLWAAKVDGQVNALDCGNLEGGNGTLDVVAAAANLFAIKPTGEKLWEYSSGGGNAVRVFDFAGDGKPEVVVASNSIRVVDSAGQMIYKSGTYGNINSLDIGNLTTSGYATIVFGSKDHKVRALDATKYSLSSSGDSYYLLADKAYRAQDYNLTRYYGLKAQDMYAAAGRDSDKTKAANLVAKSGQYSDGDKDADMADSFFKAGDYKQAVEYADKAAAEYKSVNDLHRLTDLQALKSKAQAIPEAENSMNLTRQYFASADYGNAIAYAAKAKTAYTALKNDTLVAEANSITEKSQTYLDFNTQIDAAFKYAKDNDYGNATYYISLADKDYQRLNDSALKARIENATNAANSIKRSQDMITYGGIGVVALIILLILAAVALIVMFFLKKGGFSGLGKGGGSSSANDQGGAGLRGLRGKRGESIGDSFKR